MKLLGNAVVPAQVRCALSGSLQWPWMAGNLWGGDPERWPHSGTLLAGRYHGWVRERRGRRMVGAAGARGRHGLLFAFVRARAGAAKLPILEGCHMRRGVGTPRRLQGVASAPTRRNICDFGTSVAFCLDLNRNTEPQGSVVKSQFTCLAMGYPEDWTEE